MAWCHQAASHNLSHVDTYAYHHMAPLGLNELKTQQDKDLYKSEIRINIKIIIKNGQRINQDFEWWLQFTLKKHQHIHFDTTTL